MNKFIKTINMHLHLKIYLLEHRKGVRNMASICLSKLFKYVSLLALIVLMSLLTVLHIKADNIKHLSVDDISKWTYVSVDKENPSITSTGHTTSNVWTYKFDDSFANHVNYSEY